MADDLDDDLAPEPAAITPSVRFREPLDLVVMVKSEGMRLDQYVQLHLGSNFSRSEVQRAIEAGGITVNGRPSKPSYKVRKNDKLHVEMPEPTHDIPVPEDIPLDILYQDEWLAVVNKPPDMVVHPAKGNWSGTLVNALAVALQGATQYRKRTTPRGHRPPARQGHERSNPRGEGRSDAPRTGDAVRDAQGVQGVRRGRGR